MATKKVKRAKPKAQKPAAGIIQPPVEHEIVTCPTCNGKGIEEIEHGMISRKCRTCKGSGKVRRRVEVGVVEPAEAPVENETIKAGDSGPEIKTNWADDDNSDDSSV